MHWKLIPEQGQTGWEKKTMPFIRALLLIPKAGGGLDPLAAPANVARQCSSTVSRYDGAGSEHAPPFLLAPSITAGVSSLWICLAPTGANMQRRVKLSKEQVEDLRCYLTRLQYLNCPPLLEEQSLLLLQPPADANPKQVQ